MSKLLVDIDRDALERVRVKLGARSHADALRRLIADADGPRGYFSDHDAITDGPDGTAPQPVPPTPITPAPTPKPAPSPRSPRIIGYDADGKPITR